MIMISNREHDMGTRYVNDSPSILLSTVVSIPIISYSL